MWWLPAAGLLVVGLTVYLTSAMQVLSFSPLVSSRQAAERDSAVSEALAQQQQQLASAGNRRAVQTIQLRVGEQPDAMQVEVPIPTDARLRDSRGRRGDAATSNGDRALLSTTSDIATVLEFYRAELATLGWHEVRSFMSRPAEGVPGAGGAVSAFCQDVDGPALLVGVVSSETGPNELRLLIDTDQPGPCGSAAEPDPWNGRPPPVF